MADKHEAILGARGNTHGTFSESARFVQGVKERMHKTPNWYLLPSFQQEALDMIVHKMGRILYGNPAYLDHWDDIIGYTKLVTKELDQGVGDAKIS